MQAYLQLLRYPGGRGWRADGAVAARAARRTPRLLGCARCRKCSRECEVLLRAPSMPLAICAMHPVPSLCRASEGRPLACASWHARGLQAG
eukprot:3529529-Alexandrium_andersonii.AAC.1